MHLILVIIRHQNWVYVHVLERLGGNCWDLKHQWQLPSAVWFAAGPQTTDSTNPQEMDLVWKNLQFKQVEQEFGGKAENSEQGSRYMVKSDNQSNCLFICESTQSRANPGTDTRKARCFSILCSVHHADGLVFLPLFHLCPLLLSPKQKQKTIQKDSMMIAWGIYFKLCPLIF